jgi:hypothetical protein
MPLFTLEAVKAKHGDSLILHYGDKDHPRFILIDGGPPTVYRTFLRPRLEQIREQWSEGQPLPLEMVMVSHIDADHIAGILDLTKELIEKRDNPLCDVSVLWHNSFDEVVGNKDKEIFSKLLQKVETAGIEEALLEDFKPEERHLAVVAASVGQGRKLRRNAEILGLPINEPFIGLISSEAVIQGKKRSARFHWGDGLTLTVLGPNRTRIEKLHEKWEKELKEKGPLEAVKGAAFEDDSPYNLSSIVVLAESGGKTMLLTGDARGDDILTALENAKLIKDEPFKVDLLKMPHHGSHHNIAPVFFQGVVASHYVISGDGGFGNPEEDALKMIVDSREDDDFTVWMTYREGREGLKEKLDKFLATRKKKKRKYGVEFCADDESSLKVDLLEKVEY